MNIFRLVFFTSEKTVLGKTEKKVGVVIKDQDFCLKTRIFTGTPLDGRLAEYSVFCDARRGTHGEYDELHSSGRKRMSHTRTVQCDSSGR